MSGSSNEDLSGANPFETSEDASAEMESLISTSTKSNNPSAPDEFQDDFNFQNNDSTASDSEPSSHRSRATTINTRCRGMSVYDKNSLYPVDLEAEIQASHQDHLQFDDKNITVFNRIPSPETVENNLKTYVLLCLSFPIFIVFKLNKLHIITQLRVGN